MDNSLNFLTPELFSALVWTVIVVGGVWAASRFVRDLNREPRFPEDRAAPDNVQPSPHAAAPTTIDATKTDATTSSMKQTKRTNTKRD